MSWLTDHPVLGWLGLALALGVVEMATLTFVFLMLVGGALGGAVAAGVGLGIVGQVLVAVAVALLLLGLVRPVVVRRARSGDATLTGAAALVGRDALVIETVSVTGGRIRLAGEVWSARLAPVPEHDALLPGHGVRVQSIDGATAVVVPTLPEMRTS